MNGIWKSLLWKEWREQRWRLAVLTAVILGVATIPLLIVPEGANGLGFLQSTLTMYSVLAGMFVGTSVAASENSRRTMRFLQALPTPTWMPALVKLCVAVVVAILPILVLICAYCVSAGISDELTMSALSGMLGVASMLLWTAATGANRSDEIRAGAIAFLTCASFWLIFILIVSNHLLPKNTLNALLLALPGGPYVLIWAVTHISATSAYPGLLIALFSHGAALSWYLKRYGKVNTPPKRATTDWRLNLFRTPTAARPPFRSDWAAIAWKQFRETGPLALLAVAGIFVCVPIIYYFSSRSEYPSEFSSILGSVSASVAVFVILVSGIGVFLEDYAPRVNTFWRSRPINVDHWFAVKFVVGLVVPLLCFGILLLLSFLLSDQKLNEAHLWQAIIASAGFYVFMVWFVYALAVASYVLLRQPIYAAILAVGLLVLSCVVAVRTDFLSELAVGLNGSRIYVLAVSLLILGVPMVIAWQAVKHDWGWKTDR